MRVSAFYESMQVPNQGALLGTFCDSDACQFSALDRSFPGALASEHPGRMIVISPFSPRS